MIVSHERRASSLECQGPWIGQLWKDLTLAQIKQLDCGTRNPPNPAADPFVSTQEAVPGTRMPTLTEVFALAERYGAGKVEFNVETKLDPTKPDETVDPATFARRLVETIRGQGLTQRVTLQSFDWRTTMLAERLNQKLDTVALVWQFAGTDCDALDDECSLQAVMGDPTVKSPWTNGIDWWRYLDLARMVEAAKADVVSANWQVHDPNLGSVASSDWYLKEDPAMYHGPSVAEIQRRGLRVVPYTIDDEATMQRVIDLGVDGIISDDVDLLQLVAKRNGLE